MSEAPGKLRVLVFRIATLAAALAILAAGLFWSRGASDAGASPLNPGDAMSVWRAASPAQKRATAETIVARMQQDGTLGLQTQATRNTPDGLRFLVNELSGALDAATDRNQPAYVSPGQSMALTAERVALAKGWNQ